MRRRTTRVRGGDLAAPPSGDRRGRAAAALVVAYLAGSIPFAQLAAGGLRGADLRQVGSGTVSGSGLYDVAGFGPVVAVGCLELVKGAVGPLVAGRDRTVPAAGAAACAIVGHDWSPFVGLAGGRGIGVAIGASAAIAPEATVALALGLGLGRLARASGLGCGLAIASLPLVMGVRRGREGLKAGAVLAVPLAVKRLAGNGPPEAGWSWQVAGRRLAFDHD